MSILKKFFHKHLFKTIVYNMDTGYYTKKCSICGYKVRTQIKNETKYFTQDEIAEWAGDSAYFLGRKYD